MIPTSLLSDCRSLAISSYRLTRSCLDALREQSPTIKVLHYRFRNWGDAINPLLVEMVGGVAVRSVDIDARSLLPSPRASDADSVHSVVGSILHHADCQTVVWGSGFQDRGLTTKQVPKAVHAVRGPLTAAELRRQGISCPDVFGDPVLLLPRYYRPERRKRFRLGVIPHFSDRAHPALRRLSETGEVKIIDLRGPLLGTINTVAECEHIVSTSLHGLILADAYGVPSAWSTLGNEIPGGTFKFGDYYASIGRAGEQPSIHLETASVDDLCLATQRHEVELNLDALLGACPFRWKPENATGSQLGDTRN